MTKLEICGKEGHKPYVNPSNRKNITKCCQKITGDKLLCFITMYTEAENYLIHLNNLILLSSISHQLFSHETKYLDISYRST